MSLAGKVTGDMSLAGKVTGLLSCSVNLMLSAEHLDRPDWLPGGVGTR